MVTLPIMVLEKSNLAGLTTGIEVEHNDVDLVEICKISATQDAFFYKIEPQNRATRTTPQS